MTGMVNFSNIRNLGSGPMNYDLLPNLYNYQAPTIGTTDVGNTMPINLPMLNGVTAGAPLGITDQIKNFFTATPFATTTDKMGMKTQGLFDMGLGAAQGLMGAYLGFKNLGVARDTLEQNKRQFDLNFNSQRKLTNARLEDRQNSRVAWGGGATPTADYMAKNGI